MHNSLFQKKFSGLDKVLVRLEETHLNPFVNSSRWEDEEPLPNLKGRRGEGSELEPFKGMKKEGSESMSIDETVLEFCRFMMVGG